MAAAPARNYYEIDVAESTRLRDAVMSGGARQRVLLRGATVITMDPGIGDLDPGDVLIEGGLIAAVAADLSAAASDGQALVIDAGGMILSPGFIDAHRHCWQNQFRRLIPDADLAEYLATTHGGMALHYRPHDMYVGNMVTMLGLLDQGVTSVLDFSHNSRSRAHSDAVFQAYAESGIRAVHASAAPNAGDWEEQWPADLVRLRDEYCSNGSLTTVRLAVDPHRIRPLPELMQTAREWGLGISLDGVIGPGSAQEVVELADAGLLGPDVQLIHCTSLSDRAWAVMGEHQVGATLASTSDMQIGLGDGVPPTVKALANSIRPSLSADVEIALAGDIFTQMRATLATQRMRATERQYNGLTDSYEFISNRDVLEFATKSGAQHIGLGAVTGTLTPGKAADIIAIRAEDVNNMPKNNAIGTIVHGTESHNVAMVFIGGQLRKWQQELVGQDIGRIRSLAHESRDYIAELSGLSVNPTGAHGRRDVGPELRGHLDHITRVTEQQ